jgi:hypothetical protein
MRPMLPCAPDFEISILASIHQHKLLSHRLKPGIASFSVMIGRSMTMSRNHAQKPAIQSTVLVGARGVGGLGRGFDTDGLLVIASVYPDLSIYGRGFSC